MKILLFFIVSIINQLLLVHGQPVVPIEVQMDMNDIYYKIGPKFNIKKTIQIQRHGNRASKVIYHHLQIKDSNFANFSPEDDERALHSTGVTQIKNLTDYFLRQRYVGHLPFHFDDVPRVKKSLYVRTSNLSRTIDTAYFQIRNLYYGLLPDEVKEIINTEDVQKDFLLHTDQKNCKLLKQIINHAKNSEHQKKINDFTQWVALKYLKDHIYHPSLQDTGEDMKFSEYTKDLVDTTYGNYEEKHIYRFLKHSQNICTYIYWAKTRSGIPLQFFNMDEEEFKREAQENWIEKVCEMSVDASKLYYKMYGNDVISQLAAYEFINGYLVPYLTRINGMNATELDSDDLFYSYFVTHQEMLGPLYKLLSQKMIYKRVPPASSLFIEIVKREDDPEQLEVKMYFMNDYKTLDYQETFTISEFIKRLNSIYLHLGNDKPIEEVCKMKYTDLLRKYQDNTDAMAELQLIDAEVFLNQLTTKFKMQSVYQEWIQEYKVFSRNNIQKEDL